MGITRDQLTRIKNDYYSGPLNEALDIEANNPFWDWFMENANSFSVCEDFKDTFTNEKYLSGNCIGNSISICHDEGIEYSEGFTRVKGLYIFHSFNIFDNCVIDSTTQSNQPQFRDAKGELPTEYYGAIIPNDLLPVKSSDPQNSDYINLSSKIYDHFEQMNEKTTTS
jgi:hypothetical protein